MHGRLADVTYSDDPKKSPTNQADAFSSSVPFPPDLQKPSSAEQHLESEDMAVNSDAPASKSSSSAAPEPMPETKINSMEASSTALMPVEIPSSSSLGASASAYGFFLLLTHLYQVMPTSSRRSRPVRQAMLTLIVIQCPCSQRTSDREMKT